MGLILASGSPRRRSMLQTCGIPIHAISPADIDESLREGEDPIRYACRLSIEKAGARPAPGHWILAADTVVHTEDAVFGKPATPTEAAAILSQLSDRWHGVTTAWCLEWGGGGPLPAGVQPRYHSHTTTRVRFRALDPVTIDNYIATGDSADKAGAYGIQGLGSVLIDTVHGSYTSVVGLPLAPVLAALREVGIVPSVRSGVSADV